MTRDAREPKTDDASPTPPFPVDVVNRPARRREHARLRVVLLNAAGGQNVEAIVRCLKRPALNDADIILLCEIDRWTPRSSRRDIPADLAAMLGMSFAYVPEFGVKRVGEGGAGDSEIFAYMGNAILSAAPFESATGAAMHNPRRPRIFRRRRRGRFSRGGPIRLVGTPTGLITSMKFGGDSLTVGVTHLHSRCTPAERAQQMADYLENFPARGPAIFGGDLNTTTTELAGMRAMVRTARQMIANPARFHSPEPHEPLFERIRERGLVLEGANVAKRPTFTWSGLIPRAWRPKLDWLAVRELVPMAGSARVVSPRHSLLSRRASDHDFVTVDIHL
ncbi:MAG TPA: endonuclease/exonuclease/phosphatase family protein [Candidatus Acidoferrales bacterium]|nr:endonuclease/exonuclease/phosphatase family protein [Candidatus Acidoferrales bacterium]